MAGCGKIIMGSNMWMAVRKKKDVNEASTLTSTLRELHTQVIQLYACINW